MRSILPCSVHHHEKDIGVLKEERANANSHIAYSSILLIQSAKLHFLSSHVQFNQFYMKEVG